jgi:cytochrome c-type biogenesis protein CcmH/NrfF
VILRLAAVVLAALALAGPAAAACAHPRTSLTYLEGQIMCPTCHTTLDQSDAPAAERIKLFIQRQIDECKSADEIRTELVASFGTGILAAPSHKGFDLLAWWLPLGGIAVGALVLAFGVWRWTRSQDDAAAEPPEALDPETERRLDELLTRLD